jgi:hypothetical protein
MLLLGFADRCVTTPPRGLSSRYQLVSNPLQARFWEIATGLPPAGSCLCRWRSRMCSRSVGQCFAECRLDDVRSPVVAVGKQMPVDVEGDGGGVTEGTTWLVHAVWRYAGSGRRSNAELHTNVPSRSRTTAAKMYPSLTDPLTQSLVKSNWQAERQKPTRKFKRRPFRKRGEKED